MFRSPLSPLLCFILEFVIICVQIAIESSALFHHGICDYMYFAIACSPTRLLSVPREGCASLLGPFRGKWIYILNDILYCN